MKIFALPGIMGLVLRYTPLKKYLPIIPIQSPGIEGETPPLKHVEELAAFYLEIINKYSVETINLIGYCFGGLVSIEICRQLKMSGDERPVNLALLDIVPPGWKQEPADISKGWPVAVSEVYQANQEASFRYQLEYTPGLFDNCSIIAIWSFQAPASHQERFDQLVASHPPLTLTQEEFSHIGHLELLTPRNAEQVANLIRPLFT